MSRRTNTIKQIGEDPDEFEVRLNDHVTVDWTEEEDDAPQVYVSISVGDLSVSFYVEGNESSIGDWIMHDMLVSLNNDTFFDQENIDSRVNELPTLETWLKMAREKGAF